MPDALDMDAPVTRRELHETLDIWGGALIARIDAMVDAKFDKKFEEKFEQKFSAKFNDLRALVLTLERSLIDRMEALLDPHRGVPERVKSLDEAELPARVSKLEARVFAPKRRASKTTRRRTRRT